MGGHELPEFDDEPRSNEASGRKNGDFSEDEPPIELGDDDDLFPPIDVGPPEHSLQPDIDIGPPQHASQPDIDLGPAEHPSQPDIDIGAPTTLFQSEIDVDKPRSLTPEQPAPKPGVPPEPPVPRPPRTLAVAASSVLAVAALGGLGFFSYSSNEAVKRAAQEVADLRKKSSDDENKLKEQLAFLASAEAKSKADLAESAAKAARELDALRKEATEKLAEETKKRDAEHEQQQRENERAIAEARKRAANLSPDELAAMAAKATEASEASQLHFTAAGAYLDGRKLEVAEEQARKAVENARKANDPAAEAKALRRLVVILKEMGPNKISAALVACDDGLKLKDHLEAADKSFFELTRLELRSLKRQSATPAKAQTRRRPISGADALTVLLIALMGSPPDPAPPADLLTDLATVDEELKKGAATPNAYHVKAIVELELAKFFLEQNRPDLARPHVDEAARNARAGLKACADAPAGGTSLPELRVFRENLEQDQAQCIELLSRINKATAIVTPAPPQQPAAQPPPTPPQPNNAKKELEMATAELDKLRKAAQSLDADFSPQNPLGWAQRFRDRVIAVTRSEERLQTLAETIASQKDATGSALLVDAPPAAATRLATDAKDAEAWNGKLLATVARFIDRAKIVEEKLRKGRQEWISDAKQLAEIVGFVPTLPPGLDSTNYDTQSSVSWRKDLIERVRDKTTSPSPITITDAPVDQGRATAVYGEGLEFFEAGLAEAAELKFAAAAQIYPYDPRFLYFRALALRSTGRLADADAAARRGFDLEHARRIDTHVDQALVRVQFDARRWIESYRLTGRPPA